jgi:hypothetical protein
MRCGGRAGLSFDHLRDPVVVERAELSGARHVCRSRCFENVEAELVRRGEEAADVTNRDAGLARDASRPAGTDDDLLESPLITPREVGLDQVAGRRRVPLSRRAGSPYRFPSSIRVTRL